MMAVLALIRDHDDLEYVLPWASHLARSRSLPLSIACFHPGAMRAGETGSESLEDACRRNAANISSRSPAEVVCWDEPSHRSSVADFARENAVHLIVTAAETKGGEYATTYADDTILKQSPCLIVSLCGSPGRSVEPRRIFVAASDNSHDPVSLTIAKSLADRQGAWVTLARTETDLGDGGAALGRRELIDLAFDAGIESEDWIDFQVFESGDRSALISSAEEHDLVLVGANSPLAAELARSTTMPCVGVVKGAPPIRTWRLDRGIRSFVPHLSPADYADLILGLRKGSRLSVDFVTMLCLATIVASVGLLQDSPAVVIGSMLLAPLMTPMIGCGLALAQANQRLGRTSLLTVAVGLLLTLMTSLVIGLITPGAELTPQIYARGAPTVLDLVVALASAAAAAYALARPNLVGSIAGVAIATALVPPLCSIGLSIAYGDRGNATGASLLFLTNFLAIVLAAAVTFRLIGITSGNATREQRRWVIRVVAILGVATLLVTVPLQHALENSLVITKPQPRAYPMARTVLDAIERKVESQPDARLITAGLPSSRLSASDAIIVIGSPRDIPVEFADELVEIVRAQMHNDSLIVEIHCVNEQWSELVD